VLNRAVGLIVCSFEPCNHRVGTYSDVGLRARGWALNRAWTIGGVWVLCRGGGVRMYACGTNEFEPGGVLLSGAFIIRTFSFFLGVLLFDV